MKYRDEMNLSVINKLFIFLRILKWNLLFPLMGTTVQQVRFFISAEQQTIHLVTQMTPHILIFFVFRRKFSLD
jgi:hypothetical protein